MGMKNQIDKIGSKMVRCPNRCNGIANNPAAHILPRCLFWDAGNPCRSEQNNLTGEHDKDIDKVQGQKLKGAIVAGINPGRSSSTERNFYKTHKNSYASTVQWWENNTIAYYTRMRRLLCGLGYSGPVLWTEIAKCEKASKSPVPEQTFRTCMELYLVNELKEVPSNWTIFAVGKTTYNALSFAFRTRAIVGVPHPTGSRGYFSNLFDPKTKNVQQRISAAATTAVRSSVTVWLK